MRYLLVLHNASENYPYHGASDLTSDTVRRITIGSANARQRSQKSEASHLTRWEEGFSDLYVPTKRYGLGEAFITFRCNILLRGGNKQRFLIPRWRRLPNRSPANSG